jgi:hypothetical protein
MEENKVFKIQMYQPLKKFTGLFILAFIGFGFFAFFTVKVLNFQGVEKILDTFFPSIFILLFFSAFLGPWLFKGEVKVEGGLMIITNRKGERVTIPIQSGLKLIKQRSNVNGGNVYSYVLGIEHSSNDQKTFISFKAENVRNEFIKEARQFLNNGVIVEEKNAMDFFIGKTKIKKFSRSYRLQKKQEDLKEKLMEKHYAGGANPVETEGLKEKFRVVAIIVIIVIGYIVIRSFF